MPVWSMNGKFPPDGLPVRRQLRLLSIGADIAATNNPSGNLIPSTRNAVAHFPSAPCAADGYAMTAFSSAGKSAISNTIAQIVPQQNNESAPSQGQTHMAGILFSRFNDRYNGVKTPIHFMIAVSAPGMSPLSSNFADEQRFSTAASR